MYGEGPRRQFQRPKPAPPGTNRTRGHPLKTIPSYTARLLTVYFTFCVFFFPFPFLFCCFVAKSSPSHHLSLVDATLSLLQQDLRFCSKAPTPCIAVPAHARGCCSTLSVGLECPVTFFLFYSIQRTCGPTSTVSGRPHPSSRLPSILYLRLLP